MNVSFEVKARNVSAIQNVHLMINGKKAIKFDPINRPARPNVRSQGRLRKSEIPDSDIDFLTEILNKSNQRSKFLSRAIKKRPIPELRQNSEILISQNPVLSAPKSLPELRVKDLPKCLNMLQPFNLKPLTSTKDKKLQLDLYSRQISYLQLSNGFEIIKPKREYKYYIGPGNNEALINRILKKKPGWLKLYTPHSANFIWTQTRKSEIIETLPISEDFTVKTQLPNAYTIPIIPSNLSISLMPLSTISPSTAKVYNRIDRNLELCSKKRLYSNMKEFYETANKNVFDYLPVTFHVTKGVRDENFMAFKEKFNEFQLKIGENDDEYLRNIWLVKPGEATNRGHGISVCTSIAEVQSKLENYEYAPGKTRTYIIQKYVYRPMLYKGRKFDIRCYLLLICYNGNFQAFFYKDGYLRTSAADFSLDNVKDRMIHLTNDAVQKHSDDYGKYEDGNKLSYAEFQEYINEYCEKKVDFFESIYPLIVEIVKDSVDATSLKLNPSKRMNCFEVLGYDFMIDEFYKPWLIEVNTNPCLELSGGYLEKLIPKMLEDALHIALDQMFVADPCEFGENRFEMIFRKD